MGCSGLNEAQICLVLCVFVTDVCRSNGKSVSPGLHGVQSSTRVGLEEEKRRRGCLKLLEWEAEVAVKVKMNVGTRARKEQAKYRTDGPSSLDPSKYKPCQTGIKGQTPLPSGARPRLFPRQQSSSRVFEVARARRARSNIVRRFRGVNFKDHLPNTVQSTSTRQLVSEIDFIGHDEVKSMLHELIQHSPYPP